MHDDGPVFAGLRTFSSLTACAPGPKVAHDHAVLAFYQQGSAAIEQRGVWRLAPGDLLIVPSGEPHRHVERALVEVWGLGICASCFGEPGDRPLLAPFERVRTGGAPVVHIEAARRPFLASLLAEIEREVAHGRDPSVVRSLVHLVITEVERAAAPFAAPEASAPDVVTAALRTIEQRCLGPLSLSDVARAVGRSPAHLTTAVRRATGRSVGEWITAHRLAEARRRLLHTDEQVEIVGERVGYNDPTHFIRVFRRRHGETPAAWRASRGGLTSPPSRARG